MPFHIQALPEALFAPLFGLSDAELRARNVRRSIIADSSGTPCRVSLSEARAGETVLLLNHTHQPAETPYRSGHAIFVRRGAWQAHPAPGEVPESLLMRLLSVRLFDRDHMVIGSELCAGEALAATLEAAFARPAVGYAPLHYAGPGCYAARAVRGAA